MDDKINELLGTLKVKAEAAGKLAAKTAEKASQRAGELMDQAKASFKAAELESLISAKFELIGELVWSTTVDPEADTSHIEEYIADIDGYKAELAELREKLDQKKGKTCPNPDCGCVCGKDDRFCPKCGAVLQ